MGDSDQAAADPVIGDPLIPEVVVGLIDQTRHVCLCGNRRLTTFMNVKGGNMLRCQQCGIFFSDSVAEIAAIPEATRVIPYNDTDRDAMRRFVSVSTDVLRQRGVSFDRIALMTDEPELEPEIGFQLLGRDRSVGTGTANARFDAILVPDITSHEAMPQPFLVTLSQRLSTGGVILFRARSAAHPDLTAARMNVSPDVNPAARLFFLTPQAVRHLSVGAALDTICLTETADHWLEGELRLRTAVLDCGVMAGIGDALWSFVLAKALMAKYEVTKLRLFVQDPGGVVSRRSNHLLERFDFVERVVPATFDIQSVPAVDPDTGYFRYTLPGPVADADFMPSAPFRYQFAVNTHLEHGEDFTRIARRLDLDPALIDYDIFKQFRREPEDRQGADKLLAATGGNFVVFYLSSRYYNTEEGFNRGALWRAEDWAELGSLLHGLYRCRIVIVGASYDLDFLQDFTRLAGKNWYGIYINTIGQYSIVEICEILRAARFIVAYPSGIPIMGTYLGTPTAMFWRPQYLSMSKEYDRAGFHPDFARCWVPPEMLRARRYVDLWFGQDTPASVVTKVLAAGW